MYQCDNDVNSYNSLSMNHLRKVENKSPKIYLSTKVIYEKDIANTNPKSQNSKIFAKTNILNIDRDEKNNIIKHNSNESEENDISQKNLNFNININENLLKNKTNKTLTKLPKITKYTIKTTSNLLNLNPVKTVSNSIDKTLYKNQTLFTKNKIFVNTHIKIKNSSKKRKNSLRLSGSEIFETIHSQIDIASSESNNIINNKNNINNYNSICSNNININNNLNNKINNQLKENLNNTINKKIKAKNEPKLGKMKEYIKLPDFIGEEPLTEMLFTPVFEDLANSYNEKQYEINLYLNSNKMLNNLIYLKIPLTKDGLILTQNIVNVKKLNKENKYDEEGEENFQDNKVDTYIKEKEKPEENTQFKNSSKKLYSSISEYPGNYRNKKGTHQIKLKLSQNIIKNNSKNSENGELIETNRDSNINLHKICPSSELFGDKNSYNFKSKSINSNINYSDNKIDKSDNNSNNNDSSINEEINRMNTIYEGIEPYYKLKNENDNTLIFESRFESGNLLCAFKTEEENNYQLYLQNDTNTTGYIQWFFFRVSNTKKGKKAIFTIINMLRKKCVYKKGLKIMTYSKMQAKTENIGWHRDCENVMYYTNNLFTYNENSKKKRSLNSLTFEYEFKYDNDTVYFANCLPYFYSKLIKEIDFYEKKTKNKSFLFHKNEITQTLGGNNLILLNISSSNMLQGFSFPQLNEICNQNSSNLFSSNSFKLKSNEVENKTKVNSKKSVFMIARQHPGETVGSHVIKGCIDFLLGDSEEAKKLREIYNFQIIPMMNPDGVLVGNSRTGFAGCDLNRRWSKPNEIIHPEIFYTKSLILKTSLRQNISFIIDFHGHFGTYNSLFYCNHKEKKEVCSLFPFLCCKLSNILSFQQSTFSMPKYKNSTERLSLFRELDDNDNNNIVALETSFFGTQNINGNNEKNYYFNSKLLHEIGRDVCLGMLSYYIKYENIPIENITFFTDKENIKKFDVDMKEFEEVLLKKSNEDENENEEELSESEPSIDNFDKKEIMKLMPIVQKKKKKKGKNNNNGNNIKNKLKKFEKYLAKRKNGLEKKNLDKNKNADINIELYNPLKELIAKKMEEENKKKQNINKNSINKLLNNSNNKTKIKLLLDPKSNPLQEMEMNLPAPIPTEASTKNDYTQTEEIFFRMNWTYFIGKYKILTGKKTNSNFPNISTLPSNDIGKMDKSHLNNFSFYNNKRNEIIKNERFDNINWTKFGNIFVDEKTINQINKNDKKSTRGENHNRIIALRDRTNSKQIYFTRFNGTTLSLKKYNNNQIKNSNKSLLNKGKNFIDNNVNKGKYTYRSKIKDENKEEKDFVIIHS